MSMPIKNSYITTNFLMKDCTLVKLKNSDE